MTETQGVIEQVPCPHCYKYPAITRWPRKIKAGAIVKCKHCEKLSEVISFENGEIFKVVRLKQFFEAYEKRQMAKAELKRVLKAAGLDVKRRRIDAIGTD